LRVVGEQEGTAASEVQRKIVGENAAKLYSP